MTTGQGNGGWRRLASWLRLMRLQFYAMTIFGYGLGAMAAVRLAGHPLHWWPLLAGFLTLVLLEMASVFLNELHDLETDRLNRNSGPFTGGSRVLVNGELRPESARKAAVAIAGVAALLGLPLVLGRQPAAPIPGLAVLAAAFALGLGYSCPPLRLACRGLGEITVAVTHSLLMLLFGWHLMGGSLADPLPWQLGSPMFWSVLAAISLAGIPDADADRQAGKRTLAVRLTPTGAYRVALASIAAGLAACAWAGPPARPLFNPVQGPMVVHALCLTGLILHGLRSGASCRRIDGTLLAALTNVLWYSLAPLAVLLWRPP